LSVHGTNAAVSIQNSGREILCQRRNGLLEPQEQHYGFVSFVQQHKKYFLSLYQHRNLLLDSLSLTKEFQDTKGNISSSDDITIFGEWCGKNVMQGAAICKLSRNIFAVFAIEVIVFLFEKRRSHFSWFIFYFIFHFQLMIFFLLFVNMIVKVGTNVIISPDVIASFLFHNGPSNDNRTPNNLNRTTKTATNSERNVPSNEDTIRESLYVIPYITPPLEFVFSDFRQLEKSVALVNELVMNIDKEDPWVKENFQLSGPGEGLVW
jgi:hypothetical protein